MKKGRRKGRKKGNKEETRETTKKQRKKGRKRQGKKTKHCSTYENRYCQSALSPLPLHLFFSTVCLFCFLWHYGRVKICMYILQYIYTCNDNLIFPVITCDRYVRRRGPIATPNKARNNQHHQKTMTTRKHILINAHFQKKNGHGQPRHQKKHQKYGSMDEYMMQTIEHVEQ